MSDDVQGRLLYASYMYVRSPLVCCRAKLIRHITKLRRLLTMLNMPTTSPSTSTTIIITTTTTTTIKWLQLPNVDLDLGENDAGCGRVGALSLW